MIVTIECDCGKVFKVDGKGSGSIAPCPQCRKRNFLPNLENGMTLILVTPQAIKVFCKCYQKLKLPKELAGHRFQCPSCKLFYRIPNLDVGIQKTTIAGDPTLITGTKVEKASKLEIPDAKTARKLISPAVSVNQKLPNTPSMVPMMAQPGSFTKIVSKDSIIAPPSNFGLENVEINKAGQVDAMGGLGPLAAPSSTGSKSHSLKPLSLEINVSESNSELNQQQANQDQMSEKRVDKTSSPPIARKAKKILAPISLDIEENNTAAVINKNQNKDSKNKLSVTDNFVKTDAVDSEPKTDLDLMMTPTAISMDSPHANPKPESILAEPETKKEEEDPITHLDLMMAPLAAGLGASELKSAHNASSSETEKDNLNIQLANQSQNLPDPGPATNLEMMIPAKLTESVNDDPEFTAKESQELFSELDFGETSTPPPTQTQDPPKQNNISEKEGSQELFSGLDLQDSSPTPQPEVKSSPKPNNTSQEKEKGSEDIFADLDVGEPLPAPQPEVQKESTKPKNAPTKGGDMFADLDLSLHEESPSDSNKDLSDAGSTPPNQEKSACPNCSAVLGQNAILCIQCGLNLKTGVKVQVSEKKETLLEKGDQGKKKGIKSLVTGIFSKKK